VVVLLGSLFLVCALFAVAFGMMFLFRLLYRWSSSCLYDCLFVVFSCPSLTPLPCLFVCLFVCLFIYSPFVLLLSYFSFVCSVPPDRCTYGMVYLHTPVLVPDTHHRKKQLEGLIRVPVTRSFALPEGACGETWRICAGQELLSWDVYCDPD
jgi:hypothetical protein